MASGLAANGSGLADHVHSSTTYAPNSTMLDLALWTFTEKVYGPLGVVLCVSGAVLNMLCYLVLRKRQVLVTGNCPLIALSVSYLLLSIAMLPLLISFYCILPPSTPKPLRNTYANMIIVTVGSQAALTIHTISLWLGVLLASQRLMCIKSKTPIRQNRLLSPFCSMLSTWTIIMFVVIVSMPSYFVWEIRPRPMHLNASCISKNANSSSRNNSASCQWPETCTYYSVVYNSSPGLSTLTNVQYFVQKVVPCILMIVLSSLLILSLQQAVRNRKRLTERHSVKTVGSTDNSIDETIDDNSRKISNFSVSTMKLQTLNRRTTMMLNVVIFLMVLTQLPPAIILQVNRGVYRKFGDIFDTLSLVNNAMNFTLYCKMSSAFRREFVRQFRQRLRSIGSLPTRSMRNSTVAKQYLEVPVQPERLTTKVTSDGL